MTNTKAYFRAHMKENSKAFAFILVVVLVLSAIATFNFQSRVYEIYDGKTYHSFIDSMLYFPVTVLCASAFALPMLEFSFFKKRTNLDCVYALPISRRSMGMVHYLSGLITLFCAFTLSYLVNFISLLSLGLEKINFVPMLPHYFLCLVLGVAVYSVMVFVFNEANSAGDGFWFILSYCFVFGLILLAVAVKTNNRYILESGASIPFWVFSELTDSYAYLVEMQTKGMTFWWQMPQYIFWLVFWAVLGIASAVGFYFSFGKRRAEKTEEISDSFFGYRVLIPVCAVSGMMIFSVFDSVFLSSLLVILAIAGYAVFRRSIRFKKSDIAVLLLLVVLMFV